MAILRTCDRCTNRLSKVDGNNLGVTNGFTHYSDKGFSVSVHAGSVKTTTNWHASHMTRMGQAEFGPGSDLCEHCVAEIILGRKIPRNEVADPLIEGEDTLTPSVQPLIDYANGDGASCINAGYLARVSHNMLTHEFELVFGTDMEEHMQTVVIVNNDTNWDTMQTFLLMYADRWFGRAGMSGQAQYVKAPAPKQAPDPKPTTTILSEEIADSVDTVMFIVGDYLKAGKKAYVLYNKDRKSLVVMDGDTFANGRGPQFRFHVIVQIEDAERIALVKVSISQFIDSLRHAETIAAKKAAPKPTTLVNGKRVDQEKLDKKSKEKRGYGDVEYQYPSSLNRW